MKKFVATWTNKEVEINTDNLTALETAVMIASRNNEYEDAIGGSTWTFTVSDNAEGITSDRQFGGVCSSLTKKGYISIFVEGEDSYFCLTEKGKQLFSDYSKKDEHKYSYRETRKLSADKLRALCIEHSWYTLGDCDEYTHLMNTAENCENITTEVLAEMATDIKGHSDTVYEIPTIMWEIANICYHYFEEV